MPKTKPLPDTYPPPPPDDCRYCGSEVDLVTHEEFYGQSYDGGGKLYVCTSCHARVGVHGAETSHSDEAPLGLLADAELRDLRSEVHDLFDPMWRENGTDRQKAYDFFFGQMLGLAEHRRHVGMLTAEECRTAIRILKQQ